MALVIANGILAILAGILIIAIPGSIRWIIGGYLILSGILSLV